MTSTANDSLLILLGVLSGLLGVVVYVWTAVALAGLFRKSGEQSWQAWVPLLNLAVVLRIGGFSPWLALLGLIPGIGQLALYVLVVVAAHRIGRRFGVGPGMTVLAALVFVVWASILGLGPAHAANAATPVAAARSAARRPAPEPPPWVFSPPMSDPEPAAPASPSVPPRPSTHAPDRAVVPAARPAAGEDREGTPTALQPSPWAPPSPFAPAADAPTSGGVDPGSGTAPEPAPEPAPAGALRAGEVEPASAAGDATADAADDDPARELAPAPPTVSGGRTASADLPGLVRADTSSPPALTTPPAPDASGAGGDAGWAAEIDDVSAISPSPFPSRAASARPGVVPSMADPDASGSPLPGRRTWDAVPAAPRARAPFASDPDDFPELSGEVSAVIGAPAAGAPRTAQAAVPLQQRRAEVPDHPQDIDHTVVVARRRAAWHLVPPSGAGVPLVSDVVIVGRQPVGDPSRPRAQLVAVEDRTRTMSKTHARLELRSDTWHVTDLHSTNGVVLMSFMDAEIELEPGSEAPAGERFLLGDAELRLERPES